MYRGLNHFVEYKSQAMITTVIFDLDDTLYNEVEYCKSGFGCVADFLSKSPGTASSERIFEYLWTQFKAGNHTKTFNTALEKLGIDFDDKFINELIKVYRNHVPKITLPTDSREVLCELGEKYALALLTDGFLPAQRLKVQALGIERYCKCIMYTEQLGRDFWKPSPVGFEKLLESLETGPKACCYVADNEKKDFIAPNKLGMKTIQLIRPARLHTESSEQSAATAQYIIHKIGELPEILKKL